MEFTGTEADGVCNDASGSPSRLEFVKSISALIVAGTIVVDDEIQVAADYNTVAHPCGATASNGAAPGFDSSIVIVSLFTIVAVVSIRKKYKN